MPELPDIDYNSLFDMCLSLGERVTDTREVDVDDAELTDDGGEAFIDFEIPLLDGGVIHARGVDFSHALQMLGRKLKNRFVGMDFSGMDFTQVLLVGVSFLGCNFDGVHGSLVLGDAVLTRCNFSRANLSHSRFHMCRISGCNFSYAICDYSTFLNSTMSKSTLRFTSFRKTEFFNTNFWRCELPNSSFLRSFFKSSDFKKCMLLHADLSQSKFRSATNQDGCMLLDNDMRHTLWREAELFLHKKSTNNDVDGADFRGTLMSCFNSSVGYRASLVMPWTFHFGPRTYLPKGLLPYVYAHYRVAAALLGFGIAVAVSPFLG